jgi:myb proto-oncogene protein
MKQLEEDYHPEAPTPPITRQHFSADDDAHLLDLVARYGTEDWGAIACHFPQRNVRQVRERWRFYLNPDHIVARWTEQEEQLLLHEREMIGPRWSTIANLFPGRTAVDLKNHYATMKLRIARAQAAAKQRKKDLRRPGSDGPKPDDS